MKNNKWPELCDQLSAVFDAAQKRRKLSGEELTMLLVEQLGGQIFYLPKMYSYKAQKQAEAVYNEFNGHNHKQLAMQFGLSEPRVYQIIQEQRRLRRAKDQIALDL